MKIGHRSLISVEAAAQWRRDRERTTTLAHERRPQVAK
jgi:hypothetical protein